MGSRSDNTCSVEDASSRRCALRSVVGRGELLEVAVAVGAGIRDGIGSSSLSGGVRGGCWLLDLVWRVVNSG